ncbi:unnamed protein product [Fusarium fujikuroi]|uniref:Uncharacterized protein n=1 Tax=Fusarium fujikuroi TaxID=5127 RepID=A0A9Q9RRP4_FUSFU|nr:unnamed protein product [Fusarium fujikuroi]
MALPRHSLRLGACTTSFRVYKPFGDLFISCCFTTSNRSSLHHTHSFTINGHGDLNNSHAGRTTVEPIPDPGYAYHSLAIDPSEDVSEVQEKYRPFILDDKYKKDDWIADLELSTVIKMLEKSVSSTITSIGLSSLCKLSRSMSNFVARSYSRLLAFEAARTLHRLGCDVRVYNLAGLS